MSILVPFSFFKVRSNPNVFIDAFFLISGVVSIQHGSVLHNILYITIRTGVSYIQQSLIVVTLVTAQIFANPHPSEYLRIF